MLKNYLKIFFRNLLKNKAYSLINIGGLTIGLTAVLLIALYVQFQFSYDGQLKHIDQLYRVNLTTYAEGRLVETSARTSPAMGSIFTEEIAGIEEFSRVVILGEVIAGYEDNFIREENILLADKNFLEFFNVAIHAGNPSAMDEPLMAMLSEDMAKKIFNDIDPIGKSLSINSTNFDGTVNFEIIGIYPVLEANRHLRPEILISYASLYHFIGKQIDESYDWLNLYTYLKVDRQADISSMQDQINSNLQRHHGEQLRSSQTEWQLSLLPVNEIHTTLDYFGEFEMGVDGNKLRYFIWIAVFVLIMMYMNSINIANAKALNRSKEIGIRKVSGSNKSQLFFQFMLESLMVNLIAVLLSVMIIAVLSNKIIELFNLDLPPSIFNVGQYYYYLLGIWIFGTLVSGIYPAFILTSFSPFQALKGSMKFKLKGAFARPLLVSQLIICVVLLSGTLTIYYQLKHMREQQLGISLANKVVVRSPMFYVEGSGNYQEQMRDNLLPLPGVIQVAATDEIPGNEVYWRMDDFHREGAEKNGTMYTSLNVGRNYLDIFDIELYAGRYFNMDLEEGNEAIINQKAREALGFDDDEAAIGEMLMYGNSGIPIVGVINNFRQQGVNTAINPMVLNYSPKDLNYYIIELEQGNIPGAMASIENKFKSLFPLSPFEYYFLDEHFDKQYKSEQNFATLFSMASFIAVIIAVMGILGVTTQLVIQRSKEVSIRKIMGATFGNVLYLISKEYLAWLALCFLIGVPLSYYLLNSWLENFPVRVDFGWWFFAIPAITVTLIFIMSTMFQTIKTVLVNPADTLKSE